MDMHSGGQQEPLTPCLFYPLAEAVTEEKEEHAHDD